MLDEGETFFVPPHPHIHLAQGAIEVKENIPFIRLSLEGED
jgi:hypothetical protein